MELLLFPVELLHRICSYLPVDDILSLSLTCHHLRNVLNDNSVWKRYLPEEDLSYLEVQEQQVQSLFQLPLSSTSLCQNWLYFMRKVYVLNNWRQGNFKAYILQDTCDSNLIPDGIRSTIRSREQLLYGDNYLFLSAYFGRFEAIEVWKIEKEPVVHSTLQFETLLFDEYFQIVGSHLVFLDCCKVSVYGITVPEKVFPLEHSFLVHLEDVVFGPSGKNLRNDEVHLGWCHYIAGQHLVSIQHGQVFFHVWDIADPKKLGIFNLFDHTSKLFQSQGIPYIVNRNMLSVECSANDDIILSTYLPNDSLYFVGFNIAKKAFDGFELHHHGKITLMLLDNGFVITFTQKSERDISLKYTICTVYSYKTSQKLNERHFNDVGRNCGVKKTKIVNGKFVILCVDSLEVIDVKTLDTTSAVKCDSAYYITQTLDLLGSIFVIVCNDEFQLEIWDIKNERKCSETILFGKHSESRIYFNRSCTKMVCFEWVVGSITIFNLW